MKRAKERDGSRSACVSPREFEAASIASAPLFVKKTRLASGPGAKEASFSASWTCGA